MRDGLAVTLLDEREFEDAVRWLREQYRLDLAVLSRWPPQTGQSGVTGTGPFAVRKVAVQAAQFGVAVDAVRHAFRADAEVHPALVTEVNRLLTRYRSRRGFRQWRVPEN
jgi:hypothetical protein